MASIPLPALSIRPPEQTDLLGEYGKAVQLKNLMAQGQQQAAMAPGAQQLQQQQIQAGQQENQARQNALNEDAAYHQAISNAGGDIRKALPEIAKTAPGKYVQVKEKLDEWDKADTAKKLELLSVEQKKIALMGQLANGVKDPASLQEAVQIALRAGAIEPDKAQQLLALPADQIPAEAEKFKQTALDANQAYERTAADLKAKQEKEHNAITEVPEKERDFQAYYKSYLGANNLDKNAKNELDARQKYATLNKTVDSGAAENRANVRSDKSYQFSSTQLDKMKTPIDAVVSRLSRLNDTLAQNTPQADALIAPELMTVMAGGQGSGIRINEAEINRVVGGRSKWEDLKAAVNKWQLDPKAALSITPEQRQEIRALAQVVNNKVSAKQAALDDARTQLIGSDDPKQHRQIVAAVNSKLSQIDREGAPAAQGTPSKPSGATHTGIGSVDKKKHWLDASGKDLGLAE